MSKHKVIYLCVECKMELPYRAVLYSNGVCPYCRHVSYGTIVDCDKKVKNFIVLNPWWKFWEKRGYWKND